MHTLAHLAWGVSIHLATGYLLYSLFAHGRGRTPTGATVAVLLVGTMFPDLVDKPLVFAGVLRYGRSLGHSLLTAAVVLGVVHYVARRRSRRVLANAFALGYLSHLLLDMFQEVVAGRAYVDTAFLFWPVITSRPTGIPTPGLPISQRLLFQVVMVAAACLWVYDGVPVASDAVRAVRARATRG